MGQMLPFMSRDAPVVIVDDDPSVRDALSLLLKLEGFAHCPLGMGTRFWKRSTP